MQRRWFLICGAVAGPLFTISWFLQGLRRADYNPMRYAVSSLSVGESGWIQIGTFIITGLLIVAFSVELRRRLQGPSGSVWGPLLIGLLGIGLIGAGIFVTDPLNGYPPGTPILPTERTTHGILHDLFGIPFFLGLPIACIVFSRFFNRQVSAVGHGTRSSAGSGCSPCFLSPGWAFACCRPTQLWQRILGFCNAS